MAANVAVGARRLGTPARLVAAVGGDAFGREAIAHLERANIDIGHIMIRPRDATFYCVILLDSSGEKALIRAEGETFLPSPYELKKDAFEGISHVHFVHPNPLLFHRGRDLARKAGATLSLDLEAPDIPGKAEDIKSILSELDILFVSSRSRDSLRSVLGPLTPKKGQLVVTTKGASGALVESCEGIVQVPGRPVDCVDTLGAGDAFAAAFLHAWLGGAAPGDALSFANAAAALSTHGFGAQTALAKEDDVLSFLAETEASRA